MVTTIEALFFDNLVALFGGNLLMLGVFAIGALLSILFILRLPLIIIAPIVILPFSIVGLLVPEFRLIAGMIGGIIIGYFLYNMLTGR